MSHPGWALLGRELRLGCQHLGDLLMPVAMLLLIAVLFPLAVGPGPELLRTIAPGIVWAAALLAALPSFDRTWAMDIHAGVVDQWLASGISPIAIVFAKSAGHWITQLLPMVIAAPMVAAMLNLPTESGLVLLQSLALGTPVLTLLGVVGAALTHGANRTGSLLMFLVLPMTVPVLIFGVGAVNAVQHAQPALPALAMLGALALASVSLTPLIAGPVLNLSNR